MSDDIDDDVMDAAPTTCESASALTLYAETLPPQPMSASLEQRVLSSIAMAGRFDRFATDVARILDVTRDAANALLDQLDQPSAWSEGLFPGMSLLHVQGGPAVENAVAGFVRLQAGVVFPDHEHLGEETVLVLQGSVLDGDRIVRSGEITIMPPGSCHSFAVRPGPDLVYLVVAHEGLRIMGMEYRAGDPRL